MPRAKLARAIESLRPDGPQAPVIGAIRVSSLQVFARSLMALAGLPHDIAEIALVVIGVL